MDEKQLMEEGYYNIYGRAGVRTEMPGCSLCMGNQARVEPGCTVLSTSTRNFPNRRWETVLTFTFVLLNLLQLLHYWGKYQVLTNT